MNKKTRKPKTIVKETTCDMTPSSSRPAPTNPTPRCSSYPPPQPAGPPATLDSILAAILNLKEQVGSTLERISELEAKVFDLQEAAVNDASMVDKVVAMEVKVQDLQKTIKNTLESDFSNIKADIEKLKTMPKRNISSESLGKSCTQCEKTFMYNADLEKHMNKEHNAPKDFECTVCGKKFLLEWRLKKHAQMHTVTPRTCHFFSTNMPCPFEEIGCKFSHAILLRPATVDVHGHEEQSQLYHAALHGHEEQPQSQFYHAALHGHAEQPQFYHAAPV